MKKVIVLLSTYNGVEYLEQLLNSVLSQKDVDVEIVVRDDGSTDGTKTILKHYEDNHSNIKVMLGENEGWRKSFFDLMFSVKPQANTYYAFADQDDVWLEDKLITAVDMLRKFNTVPMLYHSNLFLVNNKLEKLGYMYQEDIVPLKKNPESYFDGIGVGATMVMNERLLKLIQEYRPVLELTHDAYVIELANLLGNSVYDLTPHILYRRHEGNATGYDKNSNQFNPTIIDRYKKYKKAPKNGFSNRAIELLNGYSHKIAKSDLKFLKNVAGYTRNGTFKANLLMNPKMKASSLRKTLQMKYRVIFNTL
ncbi:glycosyltransferase [Ligilactobacillus sp. LYQ135]